jgi:alkanesulfonate monooxygenase SsuD/methylene tetrahydromethanopterin reductase-like flavin-dependent oxidoreductase (luciferase family)
MTPAADTSRLRFGVLLDHQYERDDPIDRRIGELLEIVELCRDLGYDGVFAIHHYLANLQMLQPMPLLARLVERSGSMQLGTSIFIASLTHPVQLAEEVATLDQLSGGRFVLGVGAGYRTNEFDAFGIERTARTPRMREAVELMRALWTGEEVSFAGEHFRVDAQRASIVPLQQPHPPVWIGGNSPGGIRRIARMGLPWLAPANVKRNWAVGNLSAYREELASAGMADAVVDFPINRTLCVADDEEAARASAIDHVRRSYLAYSSYDMDYFAAKFDEFVEKSFFFGSPDGVAAKIDDFAAAGFNYFIFRTQWLGSPLELTASILERFAREVMPRFKPQ